MTDTTFEFQAVEGGVPIKMWTRGVPVDDKARDQLSRAAKMPFIFKHVAAMPDGGRGHRLRHDGRPHLADGA